MYFILYKIRISLQSHIYIYISIYLKIQITNQVYSNQYIIKPNNSKIIWEHTYHNGVSTIAKIVQCFLCPRNLLIPNITIFRHGNYQKYAYFIIKHRYQTECFWNNFHQIHLKIQYLNTSLWGQDNKKPKRYCKNLLWSHIHKGGEPSFQSKLNDFETVNFNKDYM